MEPFIQSGLKQTREQHEMLAQITAGANPDSFKLFIHVLKCQLQRRVTKDYEDWKGVPLPRETFIHVYCRNYKWQDVSHIMRRAPYDKEQKKCFRYRIQEQWVDDYIRAGEGYLLNVNRIKEEPFVDEQGQPCKKFIKPITHTRTTQIDVGYGIQWLQREKERLQNHKYPSARQKEAERRKYIHNLNCFKGILERKTEANWKKLQIKYSQELFQPDPGLRLYEKGGGLQCASQNFREYLLISSPVLNVDAEKCHATIAHIETSKRGLDAGLKDLLQGKVNIPGCMLTQQAQKIAMLAVINGAKLINSLAPNLTIPNIVKRDPNTQGRPEEFLKQQLRILNEALKKVQCAMSQWLKEFSNKETRIKLTAHILQSTEVSLLADLKKVQTNDQHDGALIPLGEELPPINTGYIKVTPKPISKPDERYAQEICGKTIEIIPFSQTGPKNMVDIIMAAGTRHIAEQEAANNQGQAPKNTLNDYNKLPDGFIGFGFSPSF
jgi:hypothetical protein